MDIIAEIVNKLSKFPAITPIYDKYSVTVEPSQKNGFEVSIDAEGRSEFIVAFDGWHEHFSEPAEAIDCFFFGLFGYCRIKVSVRGNSTHKWELQSFNNGKWETDSTTGFLFFYYWREKSVSYLQNSAS